jgi:hypothetical protein
MSQRLKAGIAVFLAYLIEFGTPVATTYLMFAKPVAAKTGGMWFYIVLFVIVIVFYTKMKGMLEKQKTGYFKITLKLFMAISAFSILYASVYAVDVNATNLRYLIAITVAGELVSYVFKALAVHFDRDFVNEMGVF